MQRPLRTYLILIQERIDRSWNKSEKLKSVRKEITVRLFLSKSMANANKLSWNLSRIVHLYTTHGIFY